MIIILIPMIGLSFPETLTAIEEKCGLQQLINVFWDVSE